jgi:DHA2 family multidrug resistance protein
MASDATTGAAPAASAAVWAGFAALCLGMFMAILDVQIVATSIPTIQAALGVAPDQMSWVQTAYLIAEVIAIPMTGFLSRALSLRLLFVGAVTLFTIASVGCAVSTSFPELIAWRVVQGFSGGTLIPAVFSAVFLLFPQRQQGLATTIAGVLAVLAPTVGPIVGGWITETYSWHWLFLINIVPGIVAALIAIRYLPKVVPQWRTVRQLDLFSLCLMAIALATLVLALKEAPHRGWVSGVVLGFLIASVICGAAFARRTLQADHPVVELRTLRDKRFATGCFLSFVLGIGLFGSVYMMPVFLAVVHGYGAFHIGQIMLVTGLAQLLTAPVAVALEQRVDPRALSAFGFLMFAVGLGMSAFQTSATDYNEMFWPQVVRGVAIMFCLLPPTRMALGHLAADKVPDASGLFNLMRNLGGAIGLALIDSIIYGRAPAFGAAIMARLQAGDMTTIQSLGLPLAQMIAAETDPAQQFAVAAAIERLALVQAMNEAWAAIAVLTALAAVSLVLVGQRRASEQTDRAN